MVFLYGGSRVIDGVMTLGTFTAFMAYQIRLIGPVQGLMGLYTGLGAARVSLKRVHEILDEPVEVQDPAAPVPLGRVRGEIVFEDVSCGHGRGADVLDGFALTVSPGEVVALAGRSGSGKSTVADLLVRHLDPDRGRVLLDGTDLRSVALAELRARVAVVAQDTFVFNTSILENVRYARDCRTSSRRSRTGSTRWWAKRGRRSRRGSGSAWRSRGRCWPIRRCSCWTRRRARWTRSRRPRWCGPTSK